MLLKKLDIFIMVIFCLLFYVGVKTAQYDLFHFSQTEIWIIKIKTKTKTIKKLKFIVWYHLHIITYCTDSHSLVKFQFHEFNTPKQPAEMLLGTTTLIGTPIGLSILLIFFFYSLIISEVAIFLCIYLFNGDNAPAITQCFVERKLCPSSDLKVFFENHLPKPGCFQEVIAAPAERSL